MAFQKLENETCQRKVKHKRHTKKLVTPSQSVQQEKVNTQEFHMNMSKIQDQVNYFCDNICESDMEED